MVDEHARFYRSVRRYTTSAMRHKRKACFQQTSHESPEELRIEIAGVIENIVHDRKTARVATSVKKRTCALSLELDKNLMLRQMEYMAQDTTIK